jgi:dipeptidyl aminopeptidase/acylaminoacyl peptidase
MSTETTASRLPLEHFFKKPDRAGVRLSPDGRRLAWLEPVELEGENGTRLRRMNLFALDLPEDPGTAPDMQAARQLTSFTARDITSAFFADDKHLVFAMDQGGDENWHLVAVRSDGSDAEPRDLTPFEGVQCNLVDDLEERPGELLFQMNKRDPEHFDVYHLELASGEMQMIAENPGNVQGWVTDHDGKLRLATTTDGVNTAMLFRATEDDEWREIATFDFKEAATPLGFTFDNQRLWVSSNVGRDKSAIFEFDPRTCEHGKLVFEHDEVDVSNLIRSYARKCAVGVSYETDKQHYDFWDARREALQEFIDRELPGKQNSLVSFSKDETRYAVYSGSDRTYGSYHLLDAPFDPEQPASASRFQLRHLFDLAPWLDEDALAPVQPIRYDARDGLEIPGYLTLPVGRTLGDGGPVLPMIVNPHGGPWARDSWRFNPEVQFLANRGWAVLQMNFRGSIGYGRDFWQKSFGQWGLAMQDDITDGVQWAVEAGIADAKRVAIYGGSYGGYATLAGITKTPELYKCAVDYVGVSNLFTWIEAFPPYWRPFLEMVYEMVGHPERDEERFRATSPLFHIDRIQCPLFVAQGANDPRVKQEESEQIVAALKARGIAIEYLLKEDEGHGFHNEENMFEFYGAMERFLEQHL